MTTIGDELFAKSKRVFAELSLPEMIVIFKACAAYGQACPDEDLPPMLTISEKLFGMTNFAAAVEHLSRQLDLCGERDSRMYYAPGTVGQALAQLGAIAGTYPACPDQSGFLWDRYERWDKEIDEVYP